MKVVVSSTGEDINSQIDPRFGRCSFFIIIDTKDMSFESFNNENIALNIFPTKICHSYTK